MEDFNKSSHVFFWLDLQVDLHMYQRTVVSGEATKKCFGSEL